MHKPKFQQGDKIFYLDNNVINSGTIYCGYSMWSLFDTMIHSYYIRNSEGSIQGTPIKESELFSSVDELSENLKTKKI